MNIFLKIKENWSRISKFIGVGVLFLLALFLVSYLRENLPGSRSGYGISEDVMSMNSKSIGYSGAMRSSQKLADFDGGVADLSVRNTVASPAYSEQAGNLEIAGYNARIETRDLKESCAKIRDLKGKDFILFENSTESDDSCQYYFKVETARSKEILEIIKGMNPRNITENISSIRDQVDDYTSEEDILKSKKEAIDASLNEAVKSYDEIARVATAANDAGSLAKIIDSKINIINVLTQQKIEIAAQLERLARDKSQQIDRVRYAYFQVDISEKKFFDIKNLQDSWRSAIRSFISDANRFLQGISIDLLVFVLMIIQYGLYLLITIVSARYAWAWIKKTWGI